MNTQKEITTSLRVPKFMYCFNPCIRTFQTAYITSLMFNFGELQIAHSALETKELFLTHAPHCSLDLNQPSFA